MSEDGIHGTPASNEQFARDHAHYNDTYGKADPPPVHRPKQKHVAAAMTHVNHYSKNSCHVKELIISCEHHEKGLREAMPEEEPGPKEKLRPGEKPKPAEKVLVLNVVPHGHANLNPLVGNRTGGGLTTLGQPLTDAALDKYSEQGEKHLDAQHDALRKAHLHARHARAAKNQGLYAKVMEFQAHRKGVAYVHSKAKFMKTYGDHVHGNAELYLSQGDPGADDIITLKANMVSHCTKHPIWSIWDCSANQWLLTPQGKEYHGTKLDQDSILAPVIPANYMEAHSILPAWVPGEKAYWLKNIEPRRYKIHFVSCDPDYAHRVIHLNVYPLIESGIQVSIIHETGKTKPPAGSWSATMHKYQEDFKQIVHTLDHIVPGGRVECEVLPEGSLTLSNQWKEEEGTNEVVWSGSIKAGATLFDLYGEKNLINVLPGFMSEFIKKVTDLGLPLRAGGKSEIEGAAEWKQAPEAVNATISGSIALTGTLYASITLVVMLRAANEDAFGVRAGALTTAVVKGELGFEPEGGHMHMPLEVTVRWEKPLDISFLFVYIWGRQNYTHSFLKDYLHPLKVCRIDLMGKS